MAETRRETPYKNKKSKIEVMRSTVNSYLVKRNYTNEEILRQNITVEDLALTAMIENESARPNSILYSCFNSDPSVIEQQFTKFVIWLNSLRNESSVSQELYTFIGPLFCHLYLEMLRGGHADRAASFLQNNLHSVDINNCNGIIKEIINVSINEKSIDGTSTIDVFRASKYKLTLTDEALDALKIYLSEHSHVVLLQVLQNWFDIEIKLKGIEIEEQSITARLNGHPEETVQPSAFSISTCRKKLTVTSEALNVLRKYLAKKKQSVLNNVLHACYDIVVTSESAAVSNKPKGVVTLYNGHTNKYMTNNYEIQDLVDTFDALNNENMFAYSYHIGHLKNSAACGLLDLKRDVIAISLLDCNICVQSVTLTRQFSDKTEQKTLLGHRGTVQALKLIPKSDCLVSVSQDKTMRIWSVKESLCRKIYHGHHYPIWCLDVSALGVYMVTGSLDSSARLWSLERADPLRIYAGHSLDITAVNFHPNSTYFMTGSVDKAIRMWDVNLGKTVRLLLGHKGTVFAVSFSPDGNYAASAGDDQRVRVWDLVAGKQMQELRTGADTTVCLKWSHNSKKLVAGSIDGTVRLWDMQVLSSTANSIHDATATFKSFPSLLSIDCFQNKFSCLSASTLSTSNFKHHQHENVVCCI